MIQILPITADLVEPFREVRLRALQDAPLAFGSTYARESQLSDEEWRQRVGTWNGDRSVALLAWDGQRPCGIAAGYLHADRPSDAVLVSMWVAPTHRRQGIGHQLVEQVVAWAESKGATTVRLMVTSINDPAIAFYERLGFIKTGRSEPYPNDAELVEHEMAIHCVKFLHRR
jgi:ribosomal protein S18 acetylase RimI-like enzyme